MEAVTSTSTFVARYVTCISKSEHNMRDGRGNINQEIKRNGRLKRGMEIGNSVSQQTEKK